MALVSKIKEVQKERQSVHHPVDCSASVFGTEEGRYLQLDTHGSAGRKMTGKVSQTLQFDYQGAKELLQLIRRAFPDLAGKSSEGHSG